MEVRRWRKRTGRTMSMVTGGVLEVIMMELETECLSPDVYRYSTEWGMNVVYYIFDFELMENLILEPVYLNKVDIHFLGLTENELFQKVLKNTFIMSSPRIMLFPEYLKDLERVSENALLPIIRGLTSMMEEIKDEKKQLWCVTNIIGMRGAVGGFYKRLLRKFCMTYGCRYLLLGFCNNDYTFLSMMNENTVLAMAELIGGSGSIRSDKGRLIQKKLFVYDFRKDTLEEFGEKDLV